MCDLFFFPVELGQEWFPAHKQMPEVSLTSTRQLPALVLGLVQWDTTFFFSLKYVLCWVLFL